MTPTGYGPHLFKVTERKAGEPSDYAKIKDDVREFCVEEMRLGLVNDLRRSGKVEITLPWQDRGACIPARRASEGFERNPSLARRAGNHAPRSPMTPSASAFSPWTCSGVVPGPYSNSASRPASI